MKISLRSKHGGRLEVLDENGQKIDGVMLVAIHAAAPDFVPVIHIAVAAQITVNADAEISRAAEVNPPEFSSAVVFGAEKAREKPRKMTANETNS